MSEQLIYEIAGAKYMLFEIPTIGKKSSDRVTSLIKKYAGIIQGIEVKQGGFFGVTVLTTKVLIPEDKVIEFNNADI